MTRAKTIKREVRARMKRTGETYVHALKAIQSMNPFDHWKERVLGITHDKLGISDTFDSNDPYDLSDSAFANYNTGVSPKEFVMKVFAEDFAMQEYDEHLRAESEEAAHEEEEL